jgi:endogenous inhibitor of DNA gyrase (YacG/DUF329 family)
MEKKCKLCGVKINFEANRKGRPKKFCSLRCRTIYHTGKTPFEKILNNCLICGRTFYSAARKAKYCSPKCRYEKSTEHKKRIVICENCGKKFETKHSTKRFCDSFCIRESTRKRLSNKYETLIKKCENCGNLYTTKRKHKKTCSKKCSVERLRKYRREKYRVNRPLSHIYNEKTSLTGGKSGKCANCGNVFVKAAHNQKFCSPKCSKRTKDRIESKKLKKAYIKKTLTKNSLLTFDDIPDWMVELKRKQLTLRRELKNGENGH